MKYAIGVGTGSDGETSLFKGSQRVKPRDSMRRYKYGNTGVARDRAAA